MIKEGLEKLQVLKKAIVNKDIEEKELFSEFQRLKEQLKVTRAQKEKLEQEFDDHLDQMLSSYG